MKRKEKRNIEAEELETKRQKRNNMFIKLSISLVFAIIIFVLLLYCSNIVINNKLNQYEKETIVVAKKDIGEQIEITKNNKKNFFELQDVQKMSLPRTYFSSINDIPDGITKHSIQKNEMIVKDDIVDSDYFVKNIKTPVVTSFSVKNVSDAVGGILRKGDEITISCYVNNSEDKEFGNGIILKNIYVSKAMDTDGAEINVSNTESKAILFNLILDIEDEQLLNSYIAKGATVRLCKVNNVKF